MRRTLVLALLLATAAHGENFVSRSDPDAVLPVTKTERGLPSAAAQAKNVYAEDFNKLRTALKDLREEVRANVINVRHYGLVGDGTFNGSAWVGTDNKAAFDALIALAGEGRTFYFPSGVYLTAGNHKPLSGQKFTGDGWHRDASLPVAGRVIGTAIVRTADVVLFDVRGTSFALGGPQHRSVEFEGLRLDGGNYPSDVVQFVSVSMAKMRRVQFVAHTGRAIYGDEWFDSRLYDMDFDGVGSTSVPIVELASTGAEPTNHIHVYGGRFESYLGTAIALTGTLTNEIYLYGVKLESIDSSKAAIDITGAHTVYLGGVQIYSNGKGAASPIPAQLKITSSYGVTGTLHSEHIPSVGPPAGVGLDSFVSIATSAAVDLALFVDSGETHLTGAAAVVSDGNGENSISIRCAFANATTKNCYNQDKAAKLEGLQVARNGEPYLTFRNFSVASGADQYHMGRVVTDGAGSRFRFLKNSSVIWNVPVAGTFQLGVGMRETEVTLTYSAGIDTNAALGNSFVVPVTNTSAFTMNNPSNGASGHRITYRFKNTAGAPMGNVSFASAFKVSGANPWILTDGSAASKPATGFNRSITFVHDGTNWVESHRATVDVPN